MLLFWFGMVWFFWVWVHPIVSDNWELMSYSNRRHTFDDLTHTTNKNNIQLHHWNEHGNKCNLYAIYHTNNEINPHLKWTNFECVGWISAVELSIMSMTYDCNLFANFFPFSELFSFISLCFCRRFISL